MSFEGLLERLDRRGTPAGQAFFVGFDLLAAGDEDLRPLPFAERRRRLELLAGQAQGLAITPQSVDMELARAWLEDAHHLGFEGVVAKRASLPYSPGRRAIVKVKHWENEDLVVGGFLGPPRGPGVPARRRLRSRGGPPVHGLHCAVVAWPAPRGGVASQGPAPHPELHGLAAARRQPLGGPPLRGVDAGCPRAGV